MFEPRSADGEVESEATGDGVDRASCNAANSSINQSQFDAYQQLQQRATESLRAFTTQPIVSSAGGASSARGGRAPPTPVVATAGSEEYVALDEMYARDYNREMDRRWANEPPLLFAAPGGEEDQLQMEGEEDGGQWSEEEGDSQQPEQRRNLFGQQQQQQNNDMDEDDPVASGEEASQHSVGGGQSETGDGGRKRTLPRMRADDNPRQRKRHCPQAPPPAEPAESPHDTRQRPECFLCAWGNALHDGIEAPHVNKLTDIIQQNYGVHHNREIATEVVLYYMNEVYDPALGMAPMTRQMVLEHLEQHTLDARIFLGEAIKAEKQLAFLFKQRMWHTDGSFDKAAVAEYRRSMGALCGYYNMQLARMNFNNGNNAEDMKKQANYMNLMMPRFDQRAPSAPRAPRRSTTGRAATTPQSVPASRMQFV